MKYNSNIPLSDVLDKAHSIVSSKMSRLQKQAQALQLEKILKEIKYASHLIQAQTRSANLPQTAQYFLDEYQTLITQAMSFENSARQQKGLNQLTSVGQLFNRKKDVKTIADNIFEEEFASILASLDAIGGINQQIDLYLTGNKSGGTRAMEQVSKKLQQKTMEQIKKAGEVYANKSVSLQIANKRAVKADVNRVEVTLTKDLSNQLQKLHELTNGKTFSLKSYSAYNQKNLQTGDINYSARSLGLGDTNLYKSITGSLSLLLDGNSARKVLFRGMQILAGESRPPDTVSSPDIVAKHFAHLRFMYELAGIGLVDENNNNTFVDYIIYNDPSSLNIAVRDTASIILEEMNNSARSNLFSGEVEIAASRVFANPLKNE